MEEKLPKYYLIAVLGGGILLTTVLFVVQFIFFSPGADRAEDPFERDQNYWTSEEYRELIETQTVESFTRSLWEQMMGESDEFSRRHPYDIVLLDKSLTEHEFDAQTALHYQRFEVLLKRIARFKELEERDDIQYLASDYEDTELILAEENLVCEQTPGVGERTGVRVYQWIIVGDGFDRRFNEFDETPDEANVVVFDSWVEIQKSLPLTLFS